MSPNTLGAGQLSGASDRHIGAQQIWVGGCADNQRLSGHTSIVSWRATKASPSTCPSPAGLGTGVGRLKVGSAVGLVAALSSL